MHGAGIAKASGGRSVASPWPARLDLGQSLSGLLLTVFMVGHAFFVSTIHLGSDAMWVVSRAFEGLYVFGRPVPGIVSFAVAAVAMLFLAHALLAVRKMPSGWREYVAIRRTAREMRHGDTSLWLWQVVTGYALVVLVSVHLYTMFTRPDLIGPYESADRVWSEAFWPLYLVLLFAVELHGGIGLYRLAMKWGWPAGADPARTRRWLKRAMWAFIVAFVALGLATLHAYVRIGIDHAPRRGEPYVPTWQQPGARP